MKKISILSLVAVLAATPMMAEAARDTSIKVNYAGPSQANTNVASTSYVQGAYKAASDRINALYDDTAVAAAESGTYVAVSANSTVGENLAALDSTVKSLQSATNNAIGSLGDLDGDAKDAETIVAAINAVDSALGGRLDTAESAIDLLNSNASTEGSVAYTVKNSAKDAAYSNASMTGVATISGAIEDLDSRIDTLNASDSTEGSVDYKIKEAVTTINSAASSLTSRVEANEDAIADLNSDATNSKSVAYAVAQEATARNNAISAAVSALDATQSQTAAENNGMLNLSITEENGVITAISGSIDSQTYDAYGDAAAAESAAKSYVDNTTLTVFTTWDSDASNNIKMNTAQNIANSTANTAVPATPAQQPGGGE